MNLRTILILGALSAFGPLAIDFYLPGFPAIALAFGTDEKHVQLTLASYFLGLSIGQLAYGPVADRFGRRVPLLFGVSLFTLGSLACAFAPNLEWLIGARFIQALGGCAGMVIARAIVSDKCDAVQSAKVFSQLMLVMGLAPILAPMLGGLLVNLYGWQSIFLSLTAFSALASLAVALGLPESMPASHPRPPLSGAFTQYRRLLGDRVFLGHALTGGIAMAGMFLILPVRRSCSSSCTASRQSITAGCSAPMRRASFWWRSSTRGWWAKKALRSFCPERSGFIWRPR